MPVESGLRSRVVDSEERHSGWIRSLCLHAGVSGMHCGLAPGNGTVNNVEVGEACAAFVQTFHLFSEWSPAGR